MARFRRPVSRRASRRVPAAGALAAAAMLVGCGGGGRSPAEGDEPDELTQSPRVTVFNADAGGWKANNGRFYSYPQSEQPCDMGVWFPTSWLSPASCFRFLTPPGGAGGEWVSSSGPWWVDPNHMQLPGGQGFGFLHVLALAQLPAGLRSGTSLADTEIRFTARIDQAFSTVQADSREGRRQGHVYLWFQTYPRPVSPCTPDPQIGENCTRQSDYILTGGWAPDHEIDRLEPGLAKDFSFTVRQGEPWRWTCLDRGINVKYDCMGVDAALVDVAAIGFVIAPVPSCPTLTGPGGELLCDTAEMAQAPSRYQAMGTFAMRGFRIQQLRPRAAVARRLDLDSLASPQPSAWARWQVGHARQLVPGQGISLRVTDRLGRSRLGLATTAAFSTLEEAGPQLELSPADPAAGQPAAELRVVDRDTSGAYTRVLAFWPYRSGDTVGLHLDGDRLLFLKNDEVFHQVPSPCDKPASCILHPFVASQSASDGAARVYAY